MIYSGGQRESNNRIFNRCQLPALPGLTGFEGFGIMKVTYIVDGFPIISRTFILNEILEVQWQGIGLRTARKGFWFHPETQRALWTE